MSVEDGPKQEIISDKDTEPRQPRVTKIKPWHKVAAKVALVGALATGGFGGLRALAGGGDTEVRPQTPSQSLEIEQPPTVESLIKETQTDLAKKSIDLSKKYPEAIKKTDNGFTMEITSEASATGETTTYELEVNGEEKNESYDPANITEVQFTIINSQNTPESERLLLNIVSDAPKGQITFTYSGFEENPFGAETANTDEKITELQKLKKQIDPLFNSASEKQPLPSVVEPE